MGDPHPQPHCAPQPPHNGGSHRAEPPLLCSPTLIYTRVCTAPLGVRPPPTPLLLLVMVISRCHSLSRVLRYAQEIIKGQERGWFAKQPPGRQVLAG